MVESLFLKVLEWKLGKVYTNCFRPLESGVLSAVISSSVHMALKHINEINSKQGFDPKYFINVRGYSFQHGLGQSARLRTLEAIADGKR